MFTSPWLRRNLAIATFLSLAASVFAHPGRTDANGGHQDRKNGGYHYHNGGGGGNRESTGSGGGFGTNGKGPYEGSTSTQGSTGNFGTTGPGYYRPQAPPTTSPSASTPSVKGLALKVKIVGISDGDTLTALDANNTEAKLRLHGVDAPEDGQAFGEKAKQHTSGLAFGKTADIKIIDTDLYGRYVAIITLPDGTVLNDALVRDGMAWWYELYAPKDKILKSYQEAAKTEKRGLWADAEPVPPWEFRKGPPVPEGQLGVFPKTTTQAPKMRQEAPQVEPHAEEVYVTRTGKKYHRGNCRYLSQSKIPTDLESAKRAYGACSVCAPPG